MSRPCPPPVAVILAGGLGTRMWPLTEHRPKPLLPIGDEPLVAHHVRRLAAAGVTDVVLATSFHAEQFLPALGDGRRWGVSITYVTEEEPLGTGGGLAHALAARPGSPDQPVVVLNGDLLSGHDLTGQIEAFRDGDASVSLHVRTVEDARPYGAVVTNDGDRVTAFVEKSPTPPTRVVNAGTYVLRRDVVEALPEGRVLSLESNVFPDLIASGADVVAWRAQADWRDVGTPEALVAANRDHVLQRDDEGALVHPTARIAPTAVLGNGTVVGADAEVGDGAVVDGSLLMTGVRVGPRSRVTSSALAPGVVVGADCVLEAAAVGDRAHLADGTRLPRGERVGPGAVLGP